MRNKTKKKGGSIVSDIKKLDSIIPRQRIFYNREGRFDTITPRMLIDGRQESSKQSLINKLDNDIIKRDNIINILNKEIDKLKEDILILNREIVDKGNECELLEKKVVCLMCLNNDRDTLLNPCNHYALCNSCATLLDNCPVCRAPINNRIKTYHI